MNKKFNIFKRLADDIAYKLQDVQRQRVRYQADRLQRKAYKLLNIAHTEGISAALHDEIETKAYKLLDHARRIRLDSYRF